MPFVFQVKEPPDELMVRRRRDELATNRAQPPENEPPWVPNDRDRVRPRCAPMAQPDDIQLTFEDGQHVLRTGLVEFQSRSWFQLDRPHQEVLAYDVTRTYASGRLDERSVLAEVDDTDLADS